MSLRRAILEELAVKAATKEPGLATWSLTDRIYNAAGGPRYRQPKIDHEGQDLWAECSEVVSRLPDRGLARIEEGRVFPL